MPKLVLYHGVKPVKEYPLISGTLSIGRNEDNTIVINDMKVSGQHAQISVKPSSYMDNTLEYTVVDSGSTNGTYINGRRLQKPYLLKHHDAIQLGEYRLQFVDEQSIGFESTRILLKEK